MPAELQLLAYRTYPICQFTELPRTPVRTPIQNGTIIGTRKQRVQLKKRKEKLWKKFEAAKITRGTSCTRRLPRLRFRFRAITPFSPPSFPSARVKPQIDEPAQSPWTAGYAPFCLGGERDHTAALDRTLFGRIPAVLVLQAPAPPHARERRDAGKADGRRDMAAIVSLPGAALRETRTK